MIITGYYYIYTYLWLKENILYWQKQKKKNRTFESSKQAKIVTEAGAPLCGNHQVNS